MADTAAFLVDQLLPDVPMRQWVLTLPYEVRYLIAYDPVLCGEVLGVFARVVLDWQQRRGEEAGLPARGSARGRDHEADYWAVDSIEKLTGLEFDWAWPGHVGPEEHERALARVHAWWRQRREKAGSPPAR